MLNGTKGAFLTYLAYMVYRYMLSKRKHTWIYILLNLSGFSRSMFRFSQICVSNNSLSNFFKLYFGLRWNYSSSYLFLGDDKNKHFCRYICKDELLLLARRARMMFNKGNTINTQFNCSCSVIDKWMAKNLNCTWIVPHYIAQIWNYHDTF